MVLYCVVVWCICTCSKKERKMYVMDLAGWVGEKGGYIILTGLREFANLCVCMCMYIVTLTLIIPKKIQIKLFPLLIRLCIS